MLNFLYPNKEISRKALALALGLLLVALMLLSAASCAKDGAPPEDAITGDRARQIALEHAALSSDVVRSERVEYDYERGEPVYEVEFRKGRVEYDYTIHAVSGEILWFEQGWDD